ncbi:uncharacterized protein RJT20DRAFT_124435 [Scheffersomyces xylosifermentans]|uniref:uncharacterized protein n=1 Tax=Scheffersomyces xylosifermentans TaxID=1304137 RepID=UPI00315C709D
MISVFKHPTARSTDPSPLLNYDGSGNTTPVLPFNYTVEGLTRDVYVKPLHSHNDYWRELPLFDALSIGAVSIESDVWYFPKSYKFVRTVTETTSNTTEEETRYFRNNEVYVGHNQVFLQPINTLFNLYLNPLYQFLNYVNPSFSWSDGSDNSQSPLLESPNSKHSVFYNSPEQPVYLWMDFKTSPNETYDAIKPLLQPFIDKGYLAYYDVDADKFVPGPVILTITGNLPTEKVQAEKKRYTFLDGPLKIYKNDTPEADLIKWSKLSRVASSSLQDLLTDKYNSSRTQEFDSDQKQRLKAIFDLAHKYNLKTRIWGDITWPYDLLDSHLKDYFQLGSDLLNVDDLKNAKDLFPN